MSEQLQRVRVTHALLTDWIKLLGEWITNSMDPVDMIVADLFKKRIFVLSAYLRLCAAAVNKSGEYPEFEEDLRVASDLSKPIHAGTGSVQILVVCQLHEWAFLPAVSMDSGVWNEIRNQVLHIVNPLLPAVPRGYEPVEKVADMVRNCTMFTDVFYARRRYAHAYLDHMTRMSQQFTGAESVHVYDKVTIACGGTPIVYVKHIVWNDEPHVCLTVYIKGLSTTYRFHASYRGVVAYHRKFKILYGVPRVATVADLVAMYGKSNDIRTSPSHHYCNCTNMYVGSGLLITDDLLIRGVPAYVGVNGNVDMYGGDDEMLCVRSKNYMPSNPTFNAGILRLHALLANPTDPYLAMVKELEYVNVNSCTYEFLAAYAKGCACGNFTDAHRLIANVCATPLMKYLCLNGL